MEPPPLELNEDVQNIVKETFQDDVKEESPRFRNLLKWLGVPPVFTTLRVNTRVQSLSDVMESLQDVLMQQCINRELEAYEMFPHPCIKDCIIIRNRGPHLHITPLDKEVIVDLACGMAVLRGADIFAQGIMAALSSMQAGDMVSVYSDILGECRKGLTQKFTGRKVFVGNGRAEIGRTELFCSTGTVSGVGVRMTAPLYEAPSLDQVLSDLVFPQNLPSIVCGHVLDPQPGEVILDMCAAPGGKTVHIATLMENKGRVVALDKTPHKVARVQHNAELWGVTIIETYPFDSRKALQEGSEPSGCPPYPPMTFDRILLDAPCSALGQRPSSRNKMRPSELMSYPTYQRKLFTKAVDLLKPGGVLVFSTCTVTRGENEAQVEWALNTFSNLQLVTQTPHIGGYRLTGTSLHEEQLERLQRFDPSALSADNLNWDTDTIGFFIAKFKKDS